MRRITRSLTFAMSLGLVLTGCGNRSDLSFSRDVRPILTEHCVECHLAGGQGHSASGFSVESYDSLMKGTKFGPVVVPGDALSSSLYRLVAGEVDDSIRMPHGKDPIDQDQILIIEQWIEQGAKNN